MTEAYCVKCKKKLIVRVTPTHILAQKAIAD